jgi:hypothetical protein
LNTFAIHPVFIIFYCYCYSRLSLGNPYSNQKKRFRKRNFRDFAENSDYFCPFTAQKAVAQRFCQLNKAWAATGLLQKN